MAIHVIADINQESANKTSQSIRADVFVVLEKAQQAQEKGDMKQSLQYLDTLKARHQNKPLNSYELAQMWNFYAYAYLESENYSAALEAFKKILAQPDLPVAMKTSTQYTLAQISLMQGKNKDAIEFLQNWFRSAENPQPEAYVLLAKAYVQDKRLNDALQPLLTAIDIAKKQNKTLKEDWYVLIQYIYAEKKDYAKQEETLKVLISQWPKKNYWLNLYGVYLQMENQEKQLYVLDSLYEQSFLNESSSLLPYIQMLAAANMPFRAAKVMEKGFVDNIIPRDVDNIERAGEYWRQAQEMEKALPYFTEIARLSSNGEAALRLAHIYLSLYNFPQAIVQIQAALNKGGLKKIWEVRFLLAQSYYHAGQYEQARQLLQDIQKLSDNDTLSKRALEWISYIDAENQRLKQVNEYLGQ